MNHRFSQKSTLEEIRARFDGDVERFSRLETGQQATIDAPLVLELVAQVAAINLSPGGALLDLGCGAGNFTLSVLGSVSPLHCTLADLSQPMLDRARGRVEATNVGGTVTTLQGDMRASDFADGSFDVILAGAVLHHLRDDQDWEAMFGRLHRWLRPGGWLFVADLVTFDDPAVQNMAWQRYGQYLEALGGAEYRHKVFDYVDQEDSPRSLKYQLELLRSTGFTDWDVLHRRSVFATYYGRKAS